MVKKLDGTIFRASLEGVRRRDAPYKRFAALFALTVALSAPAWAAMQTVTLSVPGMTCAACPITVKMALSRVDGVEMTDVSFEERRATVTFDDTRTNVEALTQATENAGYPSSVMEGNNK